VSRGYNARRKRRRQEVGPPVEPARKRGPRPKSVAAVVPLIAILAILGIVGLLGFGEEDGTSRGEIDKEVSGLLKGLPQSGSTLGTPQAPFTMRMFGDLECPTVKQFVIAYLPKIVEKWVRNGTMKIEFRSLQTDTTDEPTFFKQEIAALAAGKQNRMWNFLLIFVREQPDDLTNYATDEFLRDISSQIPGLDQTQWQRARKSPLLSERVALGLQAAHARDLRFTPSFVLIPPASESALLHSTRQEIESYWGEAVDSLTEEALGDAPAFAARAPFR
jgi:hypothetical protein